MRIENYKAMSIALSVAVSFLFVFAFATSTTTISSTGVTVTGGGGVFETLDVSATSTLATTTVTNLSIGTTTDESYILKTVGGSWYMGGDGAGYTTLTTNNATRLAFRDGVSQFSELELYDDEAWLYGRGSSGTTELTINSHNPTAGLFQLNANTIPDNSGAAIGAYFGFDFSLLDQLTDSYTAIKLNVTDTVSANVTQKYLMDLQTDSVSRFLVTSSGTTTILGNLSVGTTTDVNYILKTDGVANGNGTVYFGKNDGGWLEFFDGGDWWNLQSKSANGDVRSEVDMGLGEVGIYAYDPSRSGEAGNVTNIDYLSFYVASATNTAGVLESFRFNASYSDLDTLGDGYTAFNLSVVDTVSGNVTQKDLFNLQTSVDDGSTYQSKFLINSSGNVGIGTSTPSTRLHVRLFDGPLEAVQDGNAVAVFDNPGGNASNMHLNLPSGVGFLGNYYFTVDGVNYEAGMRYDVDNDYLALMIDGDTPGEEPFVLKGGNIGIGTTSPWALLTVGSSTPAYLLASEYYNSAYISGQLEVGGSATSSFAGNIFANGNIVANGNTYVQDLVFANSFRFYEDPMPVDDQLAEGTQHLNLTNQRNEDIFSIDEFGNLTIKGQLKQGTSTEESVISLGLTWILDQFKTIGVTIADGVMNLKSLIVSDEVCVEDVCLNKNDFRGIKELLDKNGIGQTTSTPEPVITPYPITTEPNLEATTTPPTTDVSRGRQEPIVLENQLHQLQSR